MAQLFVATPDARSGDRSERVPQQPVERPSDPPDACIHNHLQTAKMANDEDAHPASHIQLHSKDTRLSKARV